MTGKDIKCPQCGKGARDVSPDYNFDLARTDHVSRSREAWTMATCDDGHRIGIHARRLGDTTSYRVESL